MPRCWVPHNPSILVYLSIYPSRLPSADADGTPCMLPASSAGGRGDYILDGELPPFTLEPITATGATAHRQDPDSSPPHNGLGAVPPTRRFSDSVR